MASCLGRVGVGGPQRTRPGQGGAGHFEKTTRKREAQAMEGTFGI